MTKKKKPADLAKDVIAILRKKGFNRPRPARGDGYPEAILEIAQKVCDGATSSHIAFFTDSHRRIFGYHFIDRDQTLLHLFAGLEPGALAPNDYDTVLRALTTVAKSNPHTGTMDFDLDHCDDIDGSTPLHLAAKSAGPEACMILLEAGANPNTLSSEGRWTRRARKTPLEVALTAGRHDSAQVLRTWLAKLVIDQVLRQNKSTMTNGVSR